MAEFLEQAVLAKLMESLVIEDTWTYAEELQVDHQELVGVIKSLLGDNYVTDEPISTSYWTLSEEGEQICRDGSSEFVVFNAVPPDGGATIAELNAAVGEAVAKIGMGQCMKNKWLKKEGEKIVRCASGVRDDTSELLRLLQTDPSAVPEDELKNLKRRKLVQQVVRKSLKVSKGGAFRPQRVRKHADLTKEMLGARGEMEPGTHWSDLEFKTINLKAMGAPVVGGSYHPLLKVRAEFRRILMEMGFEEMPTNKWVDSSFWNFDALFQPQSHPARDAHDTFFIKDPANATGFGSEDYYEVVKNTHERGGFGSIGYGCVFKREETTKNLLRTHTTAISAQMLYRLANQEGKVYAMIIFIHLFKQIRK